jgi:[ribosomal protein S5]-alanine N-acetyltransferase
MPLPDQTPVLHAGDLVLRGFVPDDVEGRMACGQDPEIIRMLGGTPDFSEPRAMSRRDAEDWYERVSGDPNPLHWAVAQDGRFIGTTRLHRFREGDQKAQYGVGILDRSLFGQGLGQRITRTVLTYAFAELGLHRVGLKVFAVNERAIRCYRHCGFVEEGLEREAAFVDGTWYDDVIMGVLAREFVPDPVTR